MDVVSHVANWMLCFRSCGWILGHSFGTSSVPMGRSLVFQWLWLQQPIVLWTAGLRSGRLRSRGHVPKLGWEFWTELLCSAARIRTATVIGLWRGLPASHKSQSEFLSEWQRLQRFCSHPTSSYAQLTPFPSFGSCLAPRALSAWALGCQRGVL